MKELASRTKHEVYCRVLIGFGTLDVVCDTANMQVIVRCVGNQNGVCKKLYGINQRKTYNRQRKKQKVLDCK